VNPSTIRGECRRSIRSLVGHQVPRDVKEQRPRAGRGLRGTLSGVLFVICAHTGPARRIATARIARECVAVILQGKL
jgi:hypothetical protein